MKKEITKNDYGLCMPLTGKNMQALEDEISQGALENYDFFEWRRDYFEDDLKDESDYLKKIRTLIKEKALIYTFRNEREGGVSTLPDQVRLAKIKGAIKSGLVDYIDIELNNQAYFLGEIEKMIGDSIVKKILSYHDFDQTPPDRTIIQLLDQMVLNQADVLKLALHPRSKDDLRRLIRLSLNYSQKTPKPIVLIAMGVLGKITRVAPEICGGSLSFSSGKKSTAPGQVSFEEISRQRKVLGLE